MFQIIKRDGKVVDFDLSKISGAIEKAFIAQKRVQQPDYRHARIECSIRR